MRQPFCRLVAGFLTGLCQRLSVGTVETLTLTALIGDEGPESISKGFPVLLHPVFHHVRAVRTSLRVAVDSVYELAPSVAHFFLNLEPCYLDVLPPIGVRGLSTGLQNPIHCLEACRTVRMPEATGPHLTGGEITEFSH